MNLSEINNYSSEEIYNNLDDLYFQWLYKLAFNDDNSYHNLAVALNNVPFIYNSDMDENRYEDGINLRYRFGFDLNVPMPIISEIIDYRDCSMLEMMVALTIRIEEFMTGPNIANRTHIWFHDMLCSLHLSEMTDDHAFDQRYFEEHMEIFLNHLYSPNGDGGLFTVNNTNIDMQTQDIWYQCMQYLNELIKKTEDI